MRHPLWSLLMIVMCTATAAAGGLGSLPPVTPDGNAERSSIPAVYRWDLSALYPDEASWTTGVAAARAELACDLAYAIAGIEARLRGRVDHGEITPEGLQPEPLRALAPSHQAGLGEHASHGGPVSSMRRHKSPSFGRRSVASDRCSPAWLSCETVSRTSGSHAELPGCRSSVISCCTRVLRCRIDANAPTNGGFPRLSARRRRRIMWLCVDLSPCLRTPEKIS